MKWLFSHFENDLLYLLLNENFFRILQYLDLLSSPDTPKQKVIEYFCHFAPKFVSIFLVCCCFCVKAALKGTQVTLQVFVLWCYTNFVRSLFCFYFSIINASWNARSRSCSHHMRIELRISNLNSNKRSNERCLQFADKLMTSKWVSGADTNRGSAYRSAAECACD